MRTRRSSTSRETLLALSVALDAKDPDCRHHSDRVARYAYSLGEHLGMDTSALDKLTAAALLHDIGVLGIPDALLRRNDQLLPHELDVVREHSVIGGRILEAAGLPEIAPWVRHHHERIDGRGYPDRLAGDAIPRESRIIAVVEALETMTANRYARPGRRASAIDELDAHKGTQFDAEVTDALIDLIVSSQLERRLEPPLVKLLEAGRIHDREWVVSRSSDRSGLVAAIAA
jgi:HD-GYP domain-containing protein (c-di-GMP phosphodiesterase class II)